MSFVFVRNCLAIGVRGIAIFIINQRRASIPAACIATGMFAAQNIGMGFFIMRYAHESRAVLRLGWWLGRAGLSELLRSVEEAISPITL